MHNQTGKLTIVPDIAGSQLTSEEDDIDGPTSQEFTTFCVQLSNYSHWKSMRVFSAGSYVEIPLYWTIGPECDVDTETFDQDMMTYDTTQYAFHRSVLIPESYTGNVVRIYSDDAHAGYVTLINERDTTEKLFFALYKLNDDDTVHGPAIRSNIRSPSHRNNIIFSLSNSAIDKVENELITTKVDETVYAIHSPHWPVEANEWIARKRFHNFPSKSVVEQVVRYGCDFVQVSHNRLLNNGEWRFSFSKAELVIIESFTMSQRIVYDTLWVLNKKISSNNLCTYYFKTLMFWACESKPAQFWNDDCLFHSVNELVIAIMQCIKSNRCVNYFIPGNNMMDHLIDTDLSYEMITLWTLLQSRQCILKVIDTCRKEELVSADTKRFIQWPAWVARAYIIQQQIDNEYDNNIDLLYTDFPTAFQDALHGELSGIYRGLCFHQKSNGCIFPSDRQIYFLKSEIHLLHATNLCELDEEAIAQYCSRENLRAITKPFMSNDTVACCPNKNNRAENKAVDNSLNESITNGRKINISVYRKANNKYNVELFKEWPGESPTVNISWFIAKAYLANLHYTTQRNTKFAANTCDDIIKVFRDSFGNEKFAERAFPVVLSTQFSSIYDKEIQELLGFYSLYSYVFDASSRSVYLGISPVLFALYIKQRIAMDKALINWQVTLTDYLKTSICDPKFSNGHGTLIIIRACQNAWERKKRQRC